MFWQDVMRRANALFGLACQMRMDCTGVRPSWLLQPRRKPPGPAHEQGPHPLLHPPPALPTVRIHAALRLLPAPARCAPWRGPAPAGAPGWGGHCRCRYSSEIRLQAHRQIARLAPPALVVEADLAVVLAVQQVVELHAGRPGGVDAVEIGRAHV